MIAQTNSTTPLNYDPKDPDKMLLPSGKTCGQCVHSRRCEMMFGHTESDRYCDWSPSRFHAALGKDKDCSHEV